MTDRQRLQYHEGKIEALEFLLASVMNVLRSTGIPDREVHKELQRALEHCPGTYDSQSYIGEGFREIFSNALSRLRDS